MTTDITPEFRARFNALATLPCQLLCTPDVHVAGNCGWCVEDKHDPKCTDCGGTGRRYPMLSERPNGIGDWRVDGLYPLFLDTEADRHRAVGALLQEAQPPKDTVRVIYTDNTRTYISFTGFPDHITRVGEGMGEFEALVMALETLAQQNV